MIRYEKEITKEQYINAVQNRNGYLSSAEERALLTDSERLGYGASCGLVFERDGKFYVQCSRWESCD